MLRETTGVETEACRQRELEGERRLRLRTARARLSPSVHGAPAAGFPPTPTQTPTLLVASHSPGSLGDGERTKVTAYTRGHTGEAASAHTRAHTHVPGAAAAVLTKPRPRSCTRRLLPRAPRDRRHKKASGPQKRTASLRRHCFPPRKTPRWG